jgi:hypothetical protein
MENKGKRTGWLQKGFRAGQKPQRVVVIIMMMMIIIIIILIIMKKPLFVHRIVNH